MFEWLLFVLRKAAKSQYFSLSKQNLVSLQSYSLFIFKITPCLRFAYVKDSIKELKLIPWSTQRKNFSI